MQDLYCRIRSGENKKYKGWLKLLKRKYRDQESCYIIEGPNLIADAVRAGADIRELIFRDEGTGGESPASGILPGAVLDALTAAGTRAYGLPSHMFDRLCSTETARDVAAVVAGPDAGIEELRARQAGGSGSVIVFDRLQDPGNVGTIIRTADAAGYAGAIAVKGTADIYSPKVVRAAAGSLFRLPVVFAEDLQEAISLAGRLGLTAVAADTEAPETCYEADLSGGIALFVGNEGAGIDKKYLAEIPGSVRIPMQGDIDSLNAGIAASVIMYENARQIREAADKKAASGGQAAAPRVSDSIPAEKDGLRSFFAAPTRALTVRARAREILLARALTEIESGFFLRDSDFDRFRLDDDSWERDMIRILPAREDLCGLRTILTPSLLAAVSRETAPQGEAGCFEIGRVFARDYGDEKALPDEQYDLSIVLAGAGGSSAELRNIVEALLEALGTGAPRFAAEDEYGPYDPADCLRVVLDTEHEEVELGITGRLHPDVIKNYMLPEGTAAAELFFDRLVEFADRMPGYKEKARKR